MPRTGRGQGGRSGNERRDRVDTGYRAGILRDPRRCPVVVTMLLLACAPRGPSGPSVGSCAVHPGARGHGGRVAAAAYGRGRRWLERDGWRLRRCQPRRVPGRLRLAGRWRRRRLRRRRPHLRLSRARRRHAHASENVRGVRQRLLSFARLAYLLDTSAGSTPGPRVFESFPDVANALDTKL